MNKNSRIKVDLIKHAALLIAIIGVMLYRGLPQPWHILMWIPIGVGYGIFYKTKDEKVEDE